VFGAGSAGGETPRLEGESEKEGAEEWGGVRDPREEGENIAELDIRAGGEQLGGDPGWPGNPRFSFWRLEIARLSRRSMSSACPPNHLGSAFTKRGDPHASSRPLYVGSFALAWSPSQGGDMAVAAIYLLQNHTRITSFSMFKLSDTNWISSLVGFGFWLKARSRAIRTVDSIEVLFLRRRPMASGELRLLQ